MSPLEIYVMLKLDDLRTLFGIIGWGGAVCIVAARAHMGCMLIDEPECKAAPVRRFIKWMAACVLLGLIGWTLTPSLKDAAIMRAGSSLASSEVVAKDMPADAAALYKLAVAALKEKLTPDTPRERE